MIGVSDGDSILMAQKLASELGLAVGISSGANFLAAVQVQDASAMMPSWPRFSLTTTRNI